MPPKWKQRLHTTWRRTSGAAPDAVKAARPVLNGGREETCRKVTRLAPTQRRGRGDQTRHVRIKRATGRPLIKGLRFKSPPAGRYVHRLAAQRYLYTKAKRLLAMQMIFTGFLR